MDMAAPQDIADTALADMVFAGTGTVDTAAAGRPPAAGIRPDTAVRQAVAASRARETGRQHESAGVAEEAEELCFVTAPVAAL